MSRRLTSIAALLAYLGVVFIFTAAPSGSGGGGSAAPTPTPNDVTFRATVNGAACANSGTASATCSNAVTGDLLLIFAADCTSTSTHTCPAGTTPVISDGTGGTTTTVCKRTAQAGDSATAWQITSSAHQLTEGCIDAYSPSAQTVAVAASAAGACSPAASTYFVGPLVTATAPPYVEIGISGSQASVPTVMEFILTAGPTTALTAQWLPSAMTQAPPMVWNRGSATTNECLSLLLSG